MLKSFFIGVGNIYILGTSSIYVLARAHWIQGANRPLLEYMSFSSPS
jgi:hypothetical protein